MKTRMLTIRGIAVQITERENCRRFILRSRPDCPYAMLSVPKRSREADIRCFLENQQEWLQAHVGAVKSPPTFTPGEVHRLMGAWVTLGKDVPSGAAFVEMRNERLIREIERDIAKWASTPHHARYPAGNDEPLGQLPQADAAADVQYAPWRCRRKYD